MQSVAAQRDDSSVLHLKTEEPPICFCRNILVTLCFDGRGFHGFQIQKNALTVQEVFQNALYKIIGGPADIKGCSRTDAGVHANQYCISFKTSHLIPVIRLRSALNRFLPYTIAVLNCVEVPIDFHARYSCKRKEYVYKIWNTEIKNPFLHGLAYHYRYKIDENQLNESAKSFIGKHDFTSFCTEDHRQKNNMVREIFNFSVSRDENLIQMSVEADGFLYNMVRIMVGTLLRVSQNKIQSDNIINIIEAKNRKYAGPTAPACGLYLNKVFYDTE